jgi:hypothetical protein
MVSWTLYHHGAVEVSSSLHAQAEPLYIFLADAFSFFSAASRAASALVSAGYPR